MATEKQRAAAKRTWTLKNPPSRTRTALKRAVARASR